MNLHTKGENCENIRNIIENKRKQNNICTICKKTLTRNSNLVQHVGEKHS